MFAVTQKFHLLRNVTTRYHTSPHDKHDVSCESWHVPSYCAAHAQGRQEAPVVRTAELDMGSGKSGPALAGTEYRLIA